MALDQIAATATARVNTSANSKSGDSVETARLRIGISSPARSPGERGELPPTPEGFTVSTPHFDDLLRFGINPVPSLKLFNSLSLHIGPIDASLGVSDHEIISQMVGYASESAVSININHPAQALSMGPDWVRPFAVDDSRPSFVFRRTTFEFDVPLELSSVSSTDESSRFLFSIIHLAANNLLPQRDAENLLPAVLQNTNFEIFRALIAGKSPAAKAIARTFLSAAINCLEIPLVNALLDTGVSPDSYLDALRRPLQIAIAKQSIDMTTLLLNRGANVNLHFETSFSTLQFETSFSTTTPLKAAVRTCDQYLVLLLLKAGAVVNDRGTEGFRLVELLLNAGADVNNHWPREQASALTTAARKSFSQLVQRSLHPHADLNPRPEDGQTALQAAVGSGDIDVVRLLLSHGADVNANHPRGHGFTALERAAPSNNVEITETLLFHGAIDVVPALNIAGQCRCHRVVDYLVHSSLETHAILDDVLGRVALRAATSCNDLELVQLVLIWGADVNGDTSCRPALQIAAHNRNIKLVNLLVDHGADINAICDETVSKDFNMTALQAAVSANDVPVVRFLLHSGALVNACVTTGSETALVAAARQRNLEIFQLLLDFGADINTQGAAAVAAVVSPDENTTSTGWIRVSRTPDSASPLEFLRFLLQAWTQASNDALVWGAPGRPALVRATDNCLEPSIIRLLLDHEAPGKLEALQRAIWDKSLPDIEVVKLLLASGADACYSDDQDSPTTLELAAVYSAPAILHLLLEHQTTALQRTQALQAAALRSRLDTVRILLYHGVDVNAAPQSNLNSRVRKEPRTALQAAAGNGDLAMVQLLLEAGADMESQVPSEQEQGTALQFAAIAGSMSVVTMLIEHDADVHARAIGHSGRTALEGAAEHGRLDVVQLLLNLGADLHGSRAVELARDEGHESVVSLLEEHP